MSLINGTSWLRTNDGKLYNTSDLTAYRLEQKDGGYCLEVRASNKYTGESIYIDWLPEEYSAHKHVLEVEKMYPINEIISQQDPE